MDEKELMRTIGNNIRRLRKARGMTQEELAEAVNRSTGAISHIENGTSALGVELLVKIAELFSVTVDKLVYPENATPCFRSISNLLSQQSAGSLARLEPYLHLWIKQHGSSETPRTKDRKRKGAESIDPGTKLLL